MGVTVSRIQRRFLICLHTSQFTRNAIQYNGKGSFCYGQRNIFLGSSKEKRTVTALARRGETPPTRTSPPGWRTPCWQGPFSNPPASSSWWSIQCYQKCPNFGFSPNSDLCTEIVLIWYDLSYQDQHWDSGLPLTLGISQKALTVKEKMDHDTPLLSWFWVNYLAHKI